MEAIKLATAGPLLRSPVTPHTYLPSSKLTLSQKEPPPPLPSDDTVRPSSTTLPWARTGRDVQPVSRVGSRSATASSAAHHAVYKTDTAVAGIPTLVTSVAFNATRPWVASRTPPATAYSRAQRPWDEKSHLGPGVYGHPDTGAVDRIDRPRSVSPVISRSERFVPPRAALGGDAVYDGAAMPMHMRSNAYGRYAEVQSAVGRFRPMPGVDADKTMTSIMAALPVGDDKNNMAEVVAKSSRNYRTVFRSRAARIAPASSGSDAYLKQRLRGVKQGSGAVAHGTIAGGIADPHGTHIVSTMRSVTANHPPLGAHTTEARLGPGTYLEGVYAADDVVRPRSMGARVLPTSQSTRFHNDTPAYKTLSTGTTFDDTVLGHRARSMARSNLVLFRNGGGHDLFTSGAMKSDAPDIVYRTDVTGSPVASMSVRAKTSPMRYSILGPRKVAAQPSSAIVDAIMSDETGVLKDDATGLAPEPSTRPQTQARTRSISPARGTLFTQLEAKVKADEDARTSNDPPPLLTTTASGRPAVLMVHHPSRPHAVMASRTGMTRSRPLSPASRAAAEAAAAAAQDEEALEDELGARPATTAPGKRKGSPAGRSQSAAHGKMQGPRPVTSPVGVRSRPPSDRNERARARVQSIKTALAELEPNKYGMELGIVVGDVPPIGGPSRTGSVHDRVSISATTTGTAAHSRRTSGSGAGTGMRRLSGGAPHMDSSEDIESILTRAAGRVRASGGPAV